MSGASSATQREPGFAFGENWRRFIDDLGDAHVFAAEQSLKGLLGELRNRRFLDMGCGSGLFSLAARRLGASVISFDSDPESVACAQLLKARYRPSDKGWKIEEGSILDEAYLRGLGVFDVIYSWGVLHHTGNMRQALELAATPAERGSRLCVAIYNDQGWLSRYWLAVKRFYNVNALGRATMIAIHAPYLVAFRMLVRGLRRDVALPRGMLLWRDMQDWLGGLPFEVAKPEEVLALYAARGFDPEIIRRCGRRHGCNEFVFRKR